MDEGSNESKEWELNEQNQRSSTILILEIGI